MNSVITGGSGTLGGEIVRLHPSCLHPTHSELSITDPDQVLAYITKAKPDLIIHTAAITSVRTCEEDKTLAWETNFRGTANLLSACEHLEAAPYFVFVSTACVFNGSDGQAPYDESSIPDPKHYYGFTKVLAEAAVQSCRLKDDALIVRTNFAARGKWKHAAAFTDRYGTYLYADDVALALDQVIRKRLTGILHVFGNTSLSMYEFARIADKDVKPMTLAEYHGPPLTIDMRLKSSRIPPFEFRKS